MLVDLVLSTYSDMAFATSVVIYIVAMMLYFGEFAATAAGQKRQAKQLVSAGGGTAESSGSGEASESQSAESTESSKSAIGIADSTDTETSQEADSTERPTTQRPLSERLGGMAVSMTVLGALVHGISLFLRGWATGRVPWGNMYEFGSSICLAAVAAWLVVLFRSSRSVSKPSRLRPLGGFLLLPAVLLLFLSGTVLYAQAAPLQPALQSYWLVIHVSAAIISSGVLLFAGVASVLYLLRSRHENNPLKLAAFGSRLPTTQVLDRLAYRATIVIMPVWTFAIVAGAIWAEAAWGRFWGWDPKETCALIAWIIYAAYLHARATAGWRGVPAAWINIAGFAAMLFNLFVINIVKTGLHSYAGL